MKTARPCAVVHVADCIDLQWRQVSAPTVKQQLASLRHLFDWPVSGQVVPVNPAASVGGPRPGLRSGKTAVLEGSQAQFSFERELSPDPLRLAGLIHNPVQADNSGCLSLSPEAQHSTAYR